MFIAHTTLYNTAAIIQMCTIIKLISHKNSYLTAMPIIIALHNYYSGTIIIIVNETIQQNLVKENKTKSLHQNDNHNLAVHCSLFPSKSTSPIIKKE